MAGIRILLTDKLDASAAETLRQAGMQVDVLPTQRREALAELLNGYHAIGVRSATRLDAELLAAAENLRLIVRGGVGVDNIDIEAASRQGIAVANTPGANTIATVELTFALMLALCRNVVPAQNSLCRGQWQRGTFRGTELYGKTLGVVGFGRIGKEVARRARAFGMRVLAYDPYLEEAVFAAEQVARAALKDLFSQSDFLTLHLPLTPETRHLIDAEALAQMKVGARLVNCARGGLLDEQAVAAALDSGRLAGVALDVYESEPPPAEHPLIGHEKVVCVPHLGASTREAQQRVAEELAQVMMDFFLHKKLTNVLNADQIDRSAGMK